MLPNLHKIVPAKFLWFRYFTCYNYCILNVGGYRVEKAPAVKRPELKELRPNIFTYLSLLVARDSLLFMKNTLRGRKYLNGDVAQFEQTVTTQDINGLINDGYLVSRGKQGEYNVLQVHTTVQNHIRNFNKNYPVTIDNFNYVIENHRKLNKGERAELMRKANALSFNFTAKELMRKVYEKGYTFDNIFSLKGTNVPCHIMLDSKNGKIYQVFPKDVYVEKVETDAEREANKVPIQYEINDKLVRVVSEQASTSFVNFAKQDYPRYQDVVESYALARKYLKECGVKTMGVLDVSRFLNDMDKVQEYNKFLLVYDMKFKELVKDSQELVDEGIVRGGFDKNPKYRKAWEKEHELSSLTNAPTVNRFIHLHRKFQDIIELYDKGDLDRYISLSFV